MERGSIGKWLLLAVGAVVFMVWGYPRLFGSNANERQPLAAPYTAPEKRTDEVFCELAGNRFDAKLSTRGASLRSLKMTDAKYAKSVHDPNTRIDLVTPDLMASRMPLTTHLRAPGDVKAEDQQVPYDELDYELTSSDASSCTFTYKDASTEITKTFALTERPFELDVSLTVKNLADTAKKHRATFEQSAWRTKAETSGKLGRLPEYDTDIVLHTNHDTHRLRADDFAPKDFAKPEFTSDKWRREKGDGVWAATSSSYFTNAVIHVAGPASPTAEAVVEEGWDAAKHPSKDDDPQFGHVFRSRLAYPEKELAKDESVTYETLAFMGPKEREVVAAIGGAKTGEVNKTTDLINMSVFIFGNFFTNTLGRVVVTYTYWLHKTLGSWGFAIIFLTITVKLLVFPLSLTGLKNSVAMRRIKPQLDEINKKYKDDMMERNVATQELMRREKVGSPMLGCLPALLQMPIWLTLYAALRSSVELYHTSFGPLIPDLSEPGLYYVIPLVLGASSFLQQKLMQASMPQADPSQAKMMLFMMPVIFTVMNVFLPAGLGVYMLTNTWLGIGQQTLMERYIQKKLREQKAGDIQVREKPAAGAEKKSEKNGAEKKDAKREASDSSADNKIVKAAEAAIGKGKARARG